MIESTSSWTNASGSNSNVLTANCTIDERKSAPGMSACVLSHASRRCAMPWAWGLPPIPGECSITLLLSVMANWPSRKKPSRGVVATQLGLPRPAFRNADWVVRDVFLARLISSSLILNGLRASNLRSVMISVITCSYQHGIADVAGIWEARLRLSHLGQQHDEDHSP